MESISLENKCLLTLDEAAIYTGLGKQKLRDLSNGETCVLWNGTKRMFKREKLKLYLESLFSI